MGRSLQEVRRRGKGNPNPNPNPNPTLGPVFNDPLSINTAMNYLPFTHQHYTNPTIEPRLGTTPMVKYMGLIWKW